jgi:hypothetical protein
MMCTELLSQDQQAVSDFLTNQDDGRGLAFLIDRKKDAVFPK